MIRNPAKLAAYVLAGWVPGGKRRCVLCGHAVRRFMPYPNGQRIPLMDALEGVGSDIEHYECPRCGSNDRERHLWLYMQSAGVVELIPRLRIVHFAPERRISRLIADARPATYVRCDLHAVGPDIHEMDIQAMSFQDGSVDLLIANHVLEHVDDDRKAVQEIHRVLAPAGAAILQTPYSPVLEATWQDDGIRSSQARLQAYGQEDHVRLFGRDIFDRFAASGLVPAVERHDALLPDIDPDLYGVNVAEPFFLFRKPR